MNDTDTAAPATNLTPEELASAATSTNSEAIAAGLKVIADQIKTDKTPEEIANSALLAVHEKAKADAKSAAEARAKRIEELKGYKDKTFVPNGATWPVITVLGYDGVKTHQDFSKGRPLAVNSDTFKVRRESDGVVWTPGATLFLSEHTQIEVPKTKTTNEII